MKDKMLFIRISEAEKELISTYAEKNGMSLSEYILLAVRLKVEADKKVK